MFYICLVVLNIAVHIKYAITSVNNIFNYMFFKVFKLTTKMDSDLMRDRISIAALHNGIPEMSLLHLSKLKPELL